ncbi:TPA: cytoplasmic protein [Enterobacter cancerogenus]
MRVPESVILTALSRGGCIRTFWRASASTAGREVPRIPDGYTLVSAGERDKTILSHTDYFICQQMCRLLKAVRLNWRKQQGARGSRAG